MHTCAHFCKNVTLWDIGLVHCEMCTKSLLGRPLQRISTVFPHKDDDSGNFYPGTLHLNQVCTTHLNSRVTNLQMILTDLMRMKSTRIMVLTMTTMRRIRINCTVTQGDQVIKVKRSARQISNPQSHHSADMSGIQIVNIFQVKAFLYNDFYFQE